MMSNVVSKATEPKAVAENGVTKTLHIFTIANEISHIIANSTKSFTFSHSVSLYASAEIIVIERRVIPRILPNIGSK